ncbi:MAG TPA: site-specific integrase [Verrucomicrobiae bacterium]|nr:site-specific integrase [Verrucomicrobiae bacterium]
MQKDREPFGRGWRTGAESEGSWLCQVVCQTCRSVSGQNPGRSGKEVSNGMIAIVFRPKRRKGGKTVVGGLYRGRYRLDHDARLTDIPLRTADKQVAQQRLLKIIQEKARERAGLIPPKAEIAVAQRPLTEHIADFIQSRVEHGRDARYIKELNYKLHRLASECGWDNTTGITADSFEKWRGRQSLANKTKNEYFHALSVFVRWLERREKIPVNPVRHVQMLTNTGNSRRERRAFTANELRRLVAVSETRRVVYMVAATTGIRRGELEQLEWRDFHLEAAKPFVNVRATIAKNHKQAALPLTQEVVSALLRHRKTEAVPSDRVFAGIIPRMERFRKDLVEAGIPYVDAKGEFADFHSLRKTFATMLILAGVPHRVVMELMRHSDPKLTTKTYTDAGQLPVTEAVSNLPLLVVTEKPDSQIDSQNLVASSLGVSSAVPQLKAIKSDNTLVNIGDSPALALLVPPGVEAYESASDGFKPCTAHHSSLSFLFPFATRTTSRLRRG